MKLILFNLDIGWVLSQVCSTTDLSHLIGRANCKSKVLWLFMFMVCWCLCFSFGGLQSTFLNQRHLNIVEKSLCSHQFDLCFKCCVGFMFSNEASQSVCGVQSFSWQQTELFVDFHGTTWSSIQLNVAQSQYWKSYLIKRDGQLGVYCSITRKPY